MALWCLRPASHPSPELVNSRHVGSQETRHPMPSISQSERAPQSPVILPRKHPPHSFGRQRLGFGFMLIHRETPSPPPPPPELAVGTRLARRKISCFSQLLLFEGWMVDKYAPRRSPFLLGWTFIVLLVPLIARQSYDFAVNVD